MISSYNKEKMCKILLKQTIAMKLRKDGCCFTYTNPNHCNEKKKKNPESGVFLNGLYQKVWNNMHKCTQEQNEENTMHKT